MALAMAGCTGERTQSVLHPASQAAASVAALWWALLVVCGVYTLIVIVLLLWAIFRRPLEDAQPRYGGRVFILIWGVILPAFILVGFLFLSLQTTVALKRPEAALTVRVVGHQWWWEVEYPELNITTANEIHIPVGEPVALELNSADVIHSFWVPELHGKIDTLPWKETSFWIEADRPGIFRGQCAEYCGLQHAHMALEVIALGPSEFAEWVAARQAPPTQVPAEPAVEVAEADELVADAGRQIFLRAGCAPCHTIRGTPADGKAGPDLTHVGSRRKIGAGLLLNNYGNLAGWIGNPQAIKPGIKMPPSYISPEELHSLVEYLQGLK